MDSAFVSLMNCEAVIFCGQEKSTLFKVVGEKTTCSPTCKTNRLSSLNVFSSLSLLLFHFHSRDFVATSFSLWPRKVSSRITFCKYHLKRCLGGISDSVLRLPEGSLELVGGLFEAFWRRLEASWGLLESFWEAS